MPMFTVLVPTYNQAQYVGLALDSLVAQTDPDWEAVVVDDGSTDGTADVLDRRAAEDCRIRVIHQPNGGTGAALNAALRHARGAWICWLSSDDLFLPDKFALHRQRIAEHPDCRFFFTRFRLLRQATGQIEDRDLWGPLPPDAYQVPGLMHRNYVSGISICVERAAWEEIGPFNERFRYAQDYDMWLRLLARCPGVFLPERTCTARNHDAQGSETFPQACIYDSAKAALEFINRTAFPQWFPGLNLRSEGVAIGAVEYAMNVATDPTSFVYCLGPNPAMLLRILEWTWPANAPEGHPAPAIARSVIDRLRRAAKQHSAGQFGQMLRELLAAARRPYPAFEHQSVVPAEVGRECYRHGLPNGEPLVRYLRQFDGLIIDESDVIRPPEPPALLHLAHETLHGTHRLAGRCRRFAGRVYRAVRRRIG